MTTRAGRHLRRQFSRLFVIGLAVVTAGSLTATAAQAHGTKPAPTPAFGSNVTIFDPSMPVEHIQAALDAAATKQTDAEMSTDRYAFLVKPGTYGTDAKPLQFKVGYYTEIAGLGARPADVAMNGKLDVYNRSLTAEISYWPALNNFWRPLSNLSVHTDGTVQPVC